MDVLEQEELLVKNYRLVYDSSGGPRRDRNVLDDAFDLAFPAAVEPGAFSESEAVVLQRGDKGLVSRS